MPQGALSTLYLSSKGKTNVAEERIDNMLVDEKTVGSTKLFSHYAQDKPFMDVDDTERFLRDMGIDPCSPQALAFAMSFGCKEMGKITLEEMHWGVCNLKIPMDDNDVETIIKNCKKALKFDHFIKDKRKCQYVYDYCYEYVMDPTSKTLSWEDAKAYWDLLLKPHFVYYEDWQDFCEMSQKSLPPYVSHDLWNILWTLASSLVDKESIRKMIEVDAWPLVIDDFLEGLSNKYLMYTERPVCS